MTTDDQALITEIQELTRLNEKVDEYLKRVQNFVESNLTLIPFVYHLKRILTRRENLALLRKELYEPYTGDEGEDMSGEDNKMDIIE